MPRTWRHPETELDVSLECDDKPNRPTRIVIRDGHTHFPVVLEPQEAEWLVARLADAIDAARAAETGPASGGP